MIQPARRADIVPGGHAEFTVVGDPDDAVSPLGEQPQQGGFVHPVVGQAPVGGDAAHAGDHLVHVEKAHVLLGQGAAGGHIHLAHPAAQAVGGDVPAVGQLHDDEHGVGDHGHVLLVFHVPGHFQRGGAVRQEHGVPVLDQVGGDLADGNLLPLVVLLAPEVLEGIAQNHAFGEEERETGTLVG